MMPEESGLRDITSFTALFEKFDIKMQMDIQEKRSDDGSVDDMDAVLTLDLSAMATMSQAAPAPEAAATDVPAVPAPEEAVEAPEVAPAEGAPEVELLSLRESAVPFC